MKVDGVIKLFTVAASDSEYATAHSSTNPKMNKAVQRSRKRRLPEDCNQSISSPKRMHLDSTSPDVTVCYMLRTKKHNVLEYYIIDFYGVTCCELSVFFIFL